MATATTLMSKDVYDFIQSARPTAPSTIDAAYTKEIRGQSKAFSIIIQSLSSVIQASLSPGARSIDAPDAHKLWNELKAKYSASVGSRQAAMLLIIFST